MAESTTHVNDIVYSLCASPDFAKDGVCFSARGSGLYRSDDGGDTWHSAYDALNLEAPLATLVVALSPDFPSNQGVYAGVPGGILRSSDGGKSWFVETLRPPPPVVSSLVISPNFAQDGVLLAGTNEDGVFRSADRGRHWSAWNFGLLDLNARGRHRDGHFPQHARRSRVARSGLSHWVRTGAQSGAVGRLRPSWRAVSRHRVSRSLSLHRWRAVLVEVGRGDSHRPRKRDHLDSGIF